jgi:spoIIIJ-associated protein
MRETEVSAKTLEEAKKAAMDKLGAREDELEYDVLNEGHSGIFGLGAQNAAIKARLKVDRVTQNILTDLVKLLDPQLKVEMSGEEEGRFAFNIEGEDVGLLIGRHGKTLEALQYVASLMASQRVGEPVRLSIDINEYQKKHFESLKTMALEMAKKVKLTRRPITLRPMPANERRLVHIALSEIADVTTYSIGVGENRQVVISPKYTERASGHWGNRNNV